MSVAPTRDRMIETATQLFRRHGYSATSWRTLVAEAGTPWGSAHHHFPGGKQQLGVAAVEHGGRLVSELTEAAFTRHADPAAAVTWMYDRAGRILAASGYADGCPLATIALETASSSPPLADAVRAAFQAWQGQLQQRFHDAGAAPARAVELAALVVTGLEGALLLSRVTRSTEPMRLAAAQAADAVRRALSPTAC